MTSDDIYIGLDLPESQDETPDDSGVAELGSA